MGQGKAGEGFSHRVRLFSRVQKNRAPELIPPVLDRLCACLNLVNQPHMLMLFTLSPCEGLYAKRETRSGVHSLVRPKALVEQESSRVRKAWPAYGDNASGVP